MKGKPVRVTVVGTRLVATLPSGEMISVDTDHAADLADAIFAQGFRSDDVHCADWRDGDCAPLAGQAIAIKARLRVLESLP